jgi:hypothetical protein
MEDVRLYALKSRPLRQGHAVFWSRWPLVFIDDGSNGLDASVFEVTQGVLELVGPLTGGCLHEIEVPYDRGAFHWLPAATTVLQPYPHDLLLLVSEA